jgi:hypothetical protein
MTKEKENVGKKELTKEENDERKKNKDVNK